MIEETVARVKGGATLLAKTKAAFDEVVGNAATVGGLVDDISVACDEQAQGIEQINRATAEMDRVTQQNAASAEESAAASRELDAQAKSMRTMIRGLAGLVGGNSGEAVGENSRQANGNDRTAKTGIPPLPLRPVRGIPSRETRELPGAFHVPGRQGYTLSEKEKAFLVQ